MARKDKPQEKYGSKTWLESQYAISDGDPWGLDWRPSQQYRYRVMLKTLLEAMPVSASVPPRRILDIGCATGLFTAMLTTLAGDKSSAVTGIDVVEDAIIQARRLYPDIEFITMSLDECASRFQASADIVTCLEVLYYLAPDQRQKALQKLKKMLRPGGVILVSSMIARRPYMSAVELRNLVGGEFEIIRAGVLYLKPIILVEKSLVRFKALTGHFGKKTVVGRKLRDWVKTHTVEWIARLSQVLLESHAQSHAYILARRAEPTEPVLPDPAPMEILTVTTFFPNSADKHRAVFVQNLVSAMRKLCRVSVVSPVPFVPPLLRLPKWNALSQIARKETVDGMDVLHPRFVVIPKLEWLSGVSYFMGVLRLFRCARKKGTGLLIHVHCAYPDGVGVALAARIVGLPYVITAHGSDINSYSTRRGLRFQIRWAISGACGVIAVSRDLRKKILRLTNARVQKIEHIPCAGYNPDLFFPQDRHVVRKRLNIADGRLVIFVGSLVPVKGADILIDAWSRLYRAGDVTEADQLVFIGEGKCRETLERQVADAGVQRCTRFLGALPQAQVSHWVAAADLLCLSSHNEGTPNVIVEALACGVPVVASRVGGIPEVLYDDVNGKLVKPGDAWEFAQAIRGALSQSWDREAVRRSVSHLTWTSIAEKNLRFLQSVYQEKTE